VTYEHTVCEVHIINNIEVMSHQTYRMSTCFVNCRSLRTLHMHIMDNIIIHLPLKESILVETQRT